LRWSCGGPGFYPDGPCAPAVDALKWRCSVDSLLGEKMSDSYGSRVYFVDWLRILAVLLLFPFHTLRVFNAGEAFYVKSPALSEAVTDVLSFISVWHMPLLFFLAGCSTYFALRRRGGGQYSWERVKRLLVPLVFGILILIPPQTWFGGRFNSGYTGSYWHYLVSGDFLRWNIQDGGDYFGGFGTGQLWFIMFLLIISLIAIPLVVWGARGRGVKRMQAVSRRLSNPVWWLVPIIVLFLGEAAPEIPGGPFVYYLFIFLFGFIAVCDPRFMESAQRYRIPSLVAGLALALFWVLSAGFRDSFPDPSLQRAGLAILGTAGVWLTLMGTLGFGRRYLDRTSRAQRYLAEGSYPVYILHQTVIVIVAFYVVTVPTAGVVQWLLLLICAVGGTFALYEIVRRFGVLRFLFGMKPRRAALRSAPIRHAEVDLREEPQ
jgi:peptidoglycan/LPS O-acetylase OafA/YrhL